MNGEVRAIRYSDVLDAPNAQELLAEYAAECSIREIGNPDPQPQMYEAFEKLGLSQIFGAYEGGTLVGFASVLIAILPHYGKRVATMESLFVASAHRKSGLGLALLKAVEQHAGHEQCAAILYSAPADGQLARLLSMREGYRLTNTVFCRGLE